MGAFLSIKALPGLSKYKYASEDNSLVSKYVLKPFYVRIVELIPKWVAPNLVTLSGLLFSMVSFCRALYFNSNFDSWETPNYVFFLHAFDIFMYQTLDALDGQQARRTGTSSPLGELFDHCVDAINTSLESYVFAATCNLPKPMVIMTQFLCCLNFFFSTWEEYHTHKLFLSIVSGPVEGILLLVGLYILTGVRGAEQLWAKDTVLGISFRDLLIYPAGFGIIYNTYAGIMNVKNLGGDFRARLRGTLPFFTTWLSIGIWAFVSWDTISTSAFLPFYISLAFIFALTVGRIITAHVTNQKYPMWTPLMFVPTLGIVLHFMLPNTPDIYNVLFASGLTIGVYGTFVTEIITEITSYLDIGCLYIKHPKKSD